MTEYIDVMITELAVGDEFTLTDEVECGDYCEHCSGEGCEPVRYYLESANPIDAMPGAYYVKARMYAPDSPWLFSKPMYRYEEMFRVVEN